MTLSGPLTFRACLLEHWGAVEGLMHLQGVPLSGWEAPSMELPHRGAQSWAPPSELGTQWAKAPSFSSRASQCLHPMMGEKTPRDPKFMD